MWRGLHFLSALVIPFVLIAMMSCVKAKEEKADLGPEVAADEIDFALGKAIHGASYSGTALNQYIHYDIVRRLESEENTINMGYTKVNVFDKIETSDQTRFSLKIEKASRNSDNTFEILQIEEPLVVKKNPIVPNLLVSPTTPGGLSAQSIAKTSAVAKKPTRSSFHRLRTSDGFLEVPNAVKAKPDCGGISPCEIPVKYVQFDLVQWYNDETYQKISIDFAFSTKTPYLPFGESLDDQLNGVLVADCRATVVPVEGRTVYVRDCLNLTDFQK